MSIQTKILNHHKELKDFVAIWEKKITKKEDKYQKIMYKTSKIIMLILKSLKILKYIKEAINITQK